MSSAVEVAVTGWEEARAGAASVRQAVFVEEQGIDPTLEWDEEGDAKSWHAVARCHHRAVGTGRLLPSAHVGRMSVLKEFRGRGIGLCILEALENKARQLGMPVMHLNAQMTAAEFYRRAGYEQEGKVFIEAGLEHVAMKKKL